MTSPISIAIIGTGLIAPRHAQAIRKCSAAHLAAFVDVNPDSKAVADDFSVPFFTSISALLEASLDHKLNAAIVCTPNHTHVALSKQLFENGIHVLVEKPICTNVREGRALCAYAQQQNLKLLVGHHRRFNPYVVATKRALEANAVGKVIAVNGLWMTKKADLYFLAPTAWRAGAEGGGVIRINLIHEIDILQHLLGPITRVFAESSQAQRGNEAEEGAAIVLRFKSGTVGTFLLSDATPSGHNFESGTGENPMIPKLGSDFYRIFGTEGTLSVPDLKVSKARDWTQKLEDEMLETEEGVPFELQIEHYIKVVKGEEEPSCDGEAGVSAVVVCEAVSRSIRKGVPIDIS